MADITIRKVDEGVAKLIARNGRGYSFEAVRAKVLYGNGLKMRKKPKYDRYLAFSFEPPEPDLYITHGNTISTLIDHLKDRPLWP